MYTSKQLALFNKLSQATDAFKTALTDVISSAYEVNHTIGQQAAAAEVPLPEKQEVKSDVIPADDTYVDDHGRYMIQPATGTAVYALFGNDVEEVRWEHTPFFVKLLKRGLVFHNAPAARAYLNLQECLQNYRVQYFLQKKVWDAAPSNMGYVWYPVLNRHGYTAIAKAQASSKAQRGKLLWHDLRDLRACINKHPTVIQALLEAGLI